MEIPLTRLKPWSSSSWMYWRESLFHIITKPVVEQGWTEVVFFFSSFVFEQKTVCFCFIIFLFFFCCVLAQEWKWCLTADLGASWQPKDRKRSLNSFILDTHCALLKELARSHSRFFFYTILQSPSSDRNSNTRTRTQTHTHNIYMSIFMHSCEWVSMCICFYLFAWVRHSV